MRERERDGQYEQSFLFRLKRFSFSRGFVVIVARQNGRLQRPPAGGRLNHELIEWLESYRQLIERRPSFWWAPVVCDDDGRKRRPRIRQRRPVASSNHLRTGRASPESKKTNAKEDEETAFIHVRGQEDNEKAGGWCVCGRTPRHAPSSSGRRLI